jgi:vancomycin resistance protein YoaR
MRIKSKNLKIWLVVQGVVFFLGFLILSGSIFIYGKIYQERVYPGVKIGELSLGGKDKEEVLDSIKEKTLQINREGFVFRAKQREVVVMPVLISLSDPDIIQEILIFDLEKTLNEAFLIGRKGNFWQRIISQWNLRRNPYFLKPSYRLNEEELLNILRENFQDLEEPAQEAKLVLDENYQFKIKPEKYGYTFDYQGAIKSLKKNLDLLALRAVDLDLIIDEPKIKKTAAENLLERAYEILNLAPLTLEYNDKKWKVDKEELAKWLEFGFEEKQDRVFLTFEKKEITKFIESLALEINIPPQEARFQMKEGRVVEFQTSREGLVLEIDKNIKKIVEEVLEKNNSEIKLIVEKVEPSIKTEEVNTFGIKELIGRGESNFAGSPKNRRHNIKIGAEKLNGLLIRPGEEFSLLKALGKTDAEAGYLPELVIKGNKTIPEYGGGLCQIATTTFRVALAAGLPILERQPHSYRVSYYEPAGMDATIYNPHPDLRFLNDTGNWILFQTKILGDDLIFEFYGTDDGRKVEISQPKIFNIVKPPPTKIIETKDLPPGQKKCTERAHSGAQAEFTRIITYPDGQIKHELWKSRYKPWQAVCLVGID